jgi:hypothetical protein
MDTEERDDRIDKIIAVSIPIVIKVIQVVLDLYAKWKEAKARAEEIVHATEKAAKDRRNAEGFRRLKARMKADWERWQREGI